VTLFLALKIEERGHKPRHVKLEEARKCFSQVNILLKPGF
jgi:hypothetical protein